MYDMFSDFFDGFDIFPHIYHEEKRCPGCGRTYSEFSKLGRLGCGKCYDTFRPTIRQVLSQTQKSSKHIGKIPSRTGGDMKAKKEYEALKAKLSEAVKNERYSEAAEIHKKIRAIEEKRGLK